MKAREGRKKMSEKWLRKLKEEFPTLAESAIRMNRRDGFLMPDERKQIESGSNRDDDNSSRKVKKRKGEEKKKRDGTKKSKTQ